MLRSCLRSARPVCRISHSILRPHNQQANRSQKQLFHQHVVPNQTQENSNYSTACIASAIVIGTGLLLKTLSDDKYFAKEKDTEPANDEPTIIPGQHKEGLPEYTKEEVRAHKTGKTGIWVHYRQGVYDITEFVEGHPGGQQKIMMAAGGSIEPFWNVYAQHQNNMVYEILESWRIGNLSDYTDPSEDKTKREGPFANEPSRSGALIVNSETPFNAETPLLLIAEDYITPTPVFYVRNHLPVPLINKEEYKLEITMKDKTIKEYSFEDLKKFPSHTITAVVQCAGNRRDELDAAQSVKGLNWRGGAIGNATWTGVYLRDVLEDAGYTLSEITNNEHCIFEGLDGDGVGTFYGSSVPMSKVMDSFGDVLLAFEMNGEEISRDHGYPVRVIVPGYVGARNVKWLSKIEVSDKESSSHWQTNDYKSFSPATDWNNIDWGCAPAIQILPVQSLICTPANGSVLSEEVDELELSGYAWSGGGRDVIRVDLCINGKWHETELTKEESNPGRSWGWSLWKATIPIPSEKGEITIQCRAVDDAYNTQPENIMSIWNARGVNNNSCHVIHLTKE